MTLALPGSELLDLSADLPATFSSLLTELPDLELRALLKIVDPTADSLFDTAARDWADQLDRMHFNHRDASLSCRARRPARPTVHGAEQVEDLTAGRRATGAR